MDQNNYKSGIVTLVGRSNVGKSTLMNALVGFKVAPVSPKAQTTRWPVNGLYEDERGQIVLVDTPGLFIKSPDKLTRVINRKLMESLKGIDLIVYVVDPSREIGQEERRLMGMVKDIKNKILVINKIDLNKPKYLADYELLADDFNEMIRVSAKKGAHLKGLINLIFEYLPQGEVLYGDEDKESYSQSKEMWLSEMIREKVFHHLQQEVPYSVQVEVEHIEENEDFLNIEALIITSNERYKPMIIGKGARKLKEITQNIRKELSILVGRKVNLKLLVKVDRRWIDRL